MLGLSSVFALIFNPFCAYAVILPSEIDLGANKEGSVLATSFEIQNDSGNPLDLVSVRSSCDCTSLNYQAGVLAPSSSTLVRFEIDTKRQSEGAHLAKLFVHLSEDGASVYKVVDVAYAIPGQNQAESVYPKRLLVPLKALESCSVHKYITVQGVASVAIRRIRLECPTAQVEKIFRLPPNKYIIRLAVHSLSVSALDGKSRLTIETAKHTHTVPLLPLLSKSEALEELTRLASENPKINGQSQNKLKE
jgi:hypothetical protein